MASTTVTENSSCTTCHDGLDYTEFSNTDTSLLMSLLEDSQVEDEDDERLRNVIQSLEAELVNEASFSESNSEGYLEYYDQLSDIEQMNSCCTSPDHLDFEWIDMEMAYSSPIFDEIGSYFMDDPQICHGMAVEEAKDIGLWQETYEPMVFG
ncbi:hypothetical protein Pfo_022607 [Paulownia fortunei]|nr:hypothetical protein Pfo_022607 [Paulownia fortunei]